MAAPGMIEKKFRDENLEKSEPKCQADIKRKKSNEARGKVTQKIKPAIDNNK